MIQTEARHESRGTTAGAAASHITYGCGDVELNLDLRPRAVGASVEVDGALVDPTNGGLIKVPAYLLRGTCILDQAETDERGTFRMRSGLKEGLRLCLILGDDRMLELELGHRRCGRRETWDATPTSRSV